MNLVQPVPFNNHKMADKGLTIDLNEKRHTIGNYRNMCLYNWRMYFDVRRIVVVFCE